MLVSIIAGREAPIPIKLVRKQVNLAIPILNSIGRQASEPQSAVVYSMSMKLEFFPLSGEINHALFSRLSHASFLNQPIHAAVHADGLA